jgi:hypothetical protein
LQFIERTLKAKTTFMQTSVAEIFHINLIHNLFIYLFI